MWQAFAKIAMECAVRDSARKSLNSNKPDAHLTPNPD